MVCTSCKNKDHEACKVQNANKMPSACDCQHRVKPGLILSDDVKLKLEVIFAK